MLKVIVSPTSKDAPQWGHVRADMGHAFPHDGHTLIQGLLALENPVPPVMGGTGR